MSFTYDSDTKERVRAATDIVDLLGSKLELRRQGRNYVALCPWHADSRPSLQINSEKQIWKCWVCDIGGDVFNFLMQDEGLTFPEALKKLAERAGIVLTPNRGGSKRTSPDIKAEIYRALKWAEELFHRHLLESSEAAAAREYLQKRGLTAEAIDSFGVGLSPDSWSTLLDQAAGQQLTPHVLEAAGLVIKKDRGGYYDRFRGRIMFPIRDRDARAIAFGGRVMPGTEGGAKYINSPETRLFQKSQQLYGFDLAQRPIRQHKQAIVMEGYTDVIIAHQCGVSNAVAVLGTALGAAHLKLLRHYCDSVILLLDGDEAGQKRSDDVLELFLHAQLDVRVMTLPEGLDPADFLQKHGAEALNQRIAGAVDALEFKLQRVSQGFDPLVDTHRANTAVEDMLSLLAKVPHSGLISNESFLLRQNQVLPRLARRFALPEDALRERLTALRQKQARYKQRTQPPQNEPARLLRPSDLTPFERELLELVIVAPQMAPIALERVQSGWLESEAALQMLGAYEQLEFDGKSLEFESVLIALEDPSLKSLLVTLHEQANAKLKYTRDTPENRLRVLTHRMGEQRDVVRRQRQITDLQKKELSEEDELDLLQDVIRQAQLRQGLVLSDSHAGDPP
ncbi:MAG: DNA primase, partial [Planctomycetales bacterium]|nr:DNA primase [Planctomycetales bacterium]